MKREEQSFGHLKCYQLQHKKDKKYVFLFSINCILIIRKQNIPINICQYYFEEFFRMFLCLIKGLFSYYLEHDSLGTDTRKDLNMLIDT